MRSIFLFSILAACSTPPAGDDTTTPDAASSNLLPGFTPAAPGADEIQIVSPIVPDIAPGADVLMCSYIPADAAFASDTDITRATGFQSSAGAHHAILYQARSKRPVDTHVCTDDDMANAIPLGVTGGEGGEAFQIPDGLALRAAAGSQLFFQTHWVNSTDHVIDGQAAFNLRALPVAPERPTASIFSIVATQFTIPAGKTGHATTTCAFQRDIQFGTLFGHAHEWGTHVTITWAPAGKAEQVIYDHDWIPHDTFAPPALTYAITTPFIVRAGDSVRVDCDYMNTTTQDLSFPREMCGAAGYYFPGDVQLNCVDGNWP